MTKLGTLGMFAVIEFMKEEGREGDRWEVSSPKLAFESRSVRRSFLRWDAFVDFETKISVKNHPLVRVSANANRDHSTLRSHLVKLLL